MRLVLQTPGGAYSRALVVRKAVTQKPSPALLRPHAPHLGDPYSASGSMHPQQAAVAGLQPPSLMGAPAAGHSPGAGPMLQAASSTGLSHHMVQAGYAPAPVAAAGVVSSRPAMHEADLRFGPNMASAAATQQQQFTGTCAVPQQQQQQQPAVPEAALAMQAPMAYMPAAAVASDAQQQHYLGSNMMLAPSMLLSTGYFPQQLQHQDGSMGAPAQAGVVPFAAQQQQQQQLLMAAPDMPSSTGLVLTSAAQAQVQPLALTASGLLTVPPEAQTSTLQQQQQQQPQFQASASAAPAAMCTPNLSSYMLANSHAGGSPPQPCNTRAPQPHTISIPLTPQQLNQINPQLGNVSAMSGASICAEQSLACGLVLVVSAATQQQLAVAWQLLQSILGVQPCAQQGEA